MTTLWSNLRAGRAFRRDALSFLLGLRQAGDVVRFKAGFSQFALVRSPDLIRRVLVTEEGRFGEGKWTRRGNHILGDCLITREGGLHQERRAVLQPSFAEGHFSAQDSAMVAGARRLADAWREGEVFDVRGEMARLALTTSAAALFGVDLEVSAREIWGSLQVIIRSIAKLPLPRRSVIAARGRLRRAAAGLRRGPMVERLREAGLADGEIDAEIVAMLFASADTTPAALSWTWCAIGRHPAVEAKLHAELSEVLGGRPPTSEDLSRLPYLRLVLTEVLRLYPPVRFIDRRTLEDMDLGGIRLRAGEDVLLSPLLTHRDPRFFEQPLIFSPERWRASDRSSQSRRAYFPFGAGAHVCIGMGLALREMGLIVAALAQHWRLKPAASLPLEPNPQTTVLPMIPERRPCRA